MKTADTQPTAVVLGLGQNGMATCRALGRVGIPVIGIDTDLDQPSARTRYATKFHCPDFLSGGPGLVDSLEQIGRGLHEKGVLFPSGDLNLAVISVHRERLEPYFHISLPPKPVVEMFLNKKMFYQFAMDKGFPLPQTLFRRAPSTCASSLAGFSIPASSSRSSPMTPGGRLRHAPVRRGFADNLVALFERLFRVHEDLIVQEYMPGPDSELWWGVTYLDEAASTRRLDRTQAPAISPPIRHRDARGKPMGSRARARVDRHPPGDGPSRLRRRRVQARPPRRPPEITEVTGGRTWFPPAWSRAPVSTCP